MKVRIFTTTCLLRLHHFTHQTSSAPFFERHAARHHHFVKEFKTMETYAKEFADTLAKSCCEKYHKLPKSGKPVVGKEFTLLAGVFVTSQKWKEPKIVSLATGSKCIGKSKLSPNGSVLNDSHAEILARRGFIRYLYQQMILILKGGYSIVLDLSNNKFNVRDDVKIHFFTSHTPCGDASIFPKNNRKRKLSTEDSEPILKISKSNETDFPSDIYRTGAKSVADPKGSGLDYHAIGVARTKPGRGDPTLSMSCSDKMARWNVCGLQGALAMHFLEKPIYLTTVVIGNCPYNEEALHRALVTRNDRLELDFPIGFVKHTPIFLQSDIKFDCFKNSNNSKTDDNRVPCSASIIWTDVLEKPLEISVNGRRQGVTSKNLDKPISRISVCRVELSKLHKEIRQLLSKNTRFCLVSAEIHFYRGMANQISIFNKKTAAFYFSTQLPSAPSLMI